MKVKIPPIKSQGIKTKLVSWIRSIVPNDFQGTWVEPFMGTGVVGFNIANKHTEFSDTNPHLVNFYQGISTGNITSQIVKNYLQEEGTILMEKGESHYYAIRKRFNDSHSPLDFLFLNRAGFNGMIRFNKKGEFNIPFCKKSQRFAKPYVTKIVNQVSNIAQILKSNKFRFSCQNFEETILKAKSNDIIYCDPPYIGRHVDYYNGWNEENEKNLFNSLSNFNGRFILSTWHHNDFRENDYIESLWNQYTIYMRKHFYHIGGKEKNRNPMIEAIITNYKVEFDEVIKPNHN